MKKNFLTVTLILFSFTLLVGCTLGNTPTAKVEDLLSKYQMLDDTIAISYTSLTTDTNLTQDIRNAYEDVIKEQYRDSAYEIKEEVIDGDTATVTIQIEVMNYKAIINKYNKNDYETIKYHELILNDLKNAKDKVTYTLDITLTKEDDDTWVVEPLTTENQNKLLGIY